MAVGRINRVTALTSVSFIRTCMVVLQGRKKVAVIMR